MAILNLDLGTKLGWALRAGPNTVSGTKSFQPGRYEGGGMRYVRFRGWLNEMAKAYEIKAVYFEEVRAHQGVDAAHVYGGFLSVLTEWCESDKIPYTGVPVATIKKHATGKGNAGKDVVIAAIEAKGFQPHDDNEADALAVMLWAIEQPGIELLV